MGAQRIVMYTRPDCEDSDAAREFLKSRGISFEEINIDEDEAARSRVMNANDGKQRTPTFNVDGRWFHGSHFDPVKFLRELETASEP